MFGLRNNCELIFAYIGAMAGLLTGLLLLGGLLPPLSGRDGLIAALLVAAFAWITVSAIFVIFYRQRPGAFPSSILWPSLVLGFAVYAIGLLFNSPLLQPAVLFAIGALLGQLLGRFVCALCAKGEFRHKPDDSALRDAIRALDARRLDARRLDARRHSGKGAARHD